MVFIGENNQICYQRESTYGTDPSGTRAWIGLVQNFNPNEEAKIHEIRGVGKGQDLAQLVKGGIDITGDFDFFIQNGQMFQYVIGSVINSGSPVYTHTFNTTDTIPSATFELAQTVAGATNDVIRRYVGTKVGKYKITATQGEPVKCSMNFISKNVSISTNGEKSSVTDPGTSSFVFHQGKVTVDGAVVAEVRTFDAEMDRTLEAHHYVDQSGCQETITAPVETQRKYNLSLTIHPTNANYLNYVLAGSEFDVQLQLIRTSGTDYAQFDYYDAKLKSAPIPGPMTGTIEQNLSFTAKTGSVVFVDSVAIYS